MISVSEIREKLSRVIDSELPLDDFEDWLVGASWNMHADSDPSAQALVSAIELRLAERSEGHLPPEQMIEEFRGLLAGRFVFHVPLNADPILQRSGASISVKRAKFLVPPVETQSLTVYA